MVLVVISLCCKLFNRSGRIHRYIHKNILNFELCAYGLVFDFPGPGARRPLLNACINVEGQQYNVPAVNLRLEQSYSDQH